MRALIIPADIELPARVEDLTGGLAELQGLVGGYLRGLSLHGMEAFMYVDEEANLKSNVPLNPRATAVTMGYIGMQDSIKGDVVIFGTPDDEGNETDVSDSTVATVRTAFESAGLA